MPATDTSILGFVAILAVAIVVAILARRLRLPYTVGLVVVGALLALTSAAPPVALTHDLIFHILLPPLLFEAALSISGKALRADWPPIALLSVAGTLVSAAVTTTGMHFVLGWPWGSASVFGVLIAATDPVAVIAMFRDGGVHGRVRLLVESESLFNDGVAAVLFAVALSVVVPGAETLSTGSALLALATIVGGGVAMGVVIGAIAVGVAGRVTDRLVETALTVVAAYGAFALAEGLHVSGVLATVSAGLVMGNVGALRDSAGSFSQEARAFVVEFWDFAAFLANSVIFPLIGISVASMGFSRGDFVLLPVAIIIVLASRALTVYPLCLLFLRSRWLVPLREQHVLFWGGLRGALALALALSLPLSLPYRDPIVVAAFGVAAFSIAVQGLTMPALLRALRIGRPPDGAPDMRR